MEKYSQDPIIQKYVDLNVNIINDPNFIHMLLITCSIQFLILPFLTELRKFEFEFFFRKSIQ